MRRVKEIALRVLMIAAGVAIILGILAWYRPADAHSWYDKSCCNDGDCRPIKSCDEIKLKRVFEHGRWRRVAIWRRYKFYNVKPSQDGKCHVCLYECAACGMFEEGDPKNVEPTPTCAYVPMQMF